MKVFGLLAILFIFTSCASRYVVPGNRFITPESQGSTFAGQFEIQQTSANTLKFDGTTGDLNGVKYESNKKTGFMASTGVIEQVDFIWNTVSEGNSMFGGKFQFLGGGRSSNSTGNKLAFAALIGSNEYKDEENGDIDFELTGKEAMLIYGFRFSPVVLLYSGLSYSQYNFKGRLYSGSLAGEEPDYETKVYALNNGLELAYEIAFIKFELSYQFVDTTQTDKMNRLAFGFSAGLSW